MINLTKFEEFSRIVEELDSLRGCVDIYRNLGQTGSFVNLDSLIYTSRGIYNILPDNTIKKVLLFQGERHFRLTDKLEGSIDPTFHLYKCDIIKNQIEQKSKRFKITTRKDSNFLITDQSYDENMKRREKKSYKKLLVCNLCFIMYNRIKRADFPKEDFSIREYLDPGHSDLTFTYNFDEIPVGYKSNWQEIAASLKDKKGGVCEKCGIKVNKMHAEKLLNVHFTTEKLYNRYTDKVKVLCLRCHAEEPGHGHIREKTEYKHFCDLYLK